MRKRRLKGRGWPRVPDRSLTGLDCVLCSCDLQTLSSQGQDGHTARGLAPVLAFLGSYYDL